MPLSLLSSICTFQSWHFIFVPGIKMVTRASNVPWKTPTGGIQDHFLNLYLWWRDSGIYHVYMHVQVYTGVYQVYTCMYRCIPGIYRVYTGIYQVFRCIHVCHKKLSLVTQVCPEATTGRRREQRLWGRHQALLEGTWHASNHDTKHSSSDPSWR